MQPMSALALPRRLLLGPGPSNVHPRVLAALAQPLVGHLDPAFLGLLDRVQAGLADLFGVRSGLTLPMPTTGSGGMETCFANLLEPGDDIVVGVAGVFGTRMCDVATRMGARVTRVDCEWGQPLASEAMIRALEETQPRLVAFVHAETSTGVEQPVEAITQAAREVGALVVLDCVTSLAGLPVQLEAWGVDAAYSGTQKCLSCPPGLSPVHFSERALDRVKDRKVPVQNWYLDTSLLAGYFGDERVYHHTAPVSAIFALAEALEMIAEEGMPARALRHREASGALLEGVSDLGFQPLVAAEHRLPMLNALELPEVVRQGAGGEAGLRRRLLEHHGIEVGGGLGALAGRIWRVGLMGENARLASVETLLGALREELS